MKLRTIKYYVVEGIKSLIKNHLMSIASIVTISACVLIITLSYIIAVNLDYSLELLEKTVGITVFLDDYLNIDDISRINNEINEIQNVDAVVYVSSSEALEELKTQLGEYQDILEGFENDNPLSESFEITLIDPAFQSNVINQLEQINGIRKISHARETTDILINISNGVRVISLIIIAALCLISIIIIMNTIKLSLYIRKNEINIMKYVGATDWFIRWPFIIESLLIGLFGSILPVLLSMLFYDKAIEITYNKFKLIMNVIHFKTAAEIFPGLIPITLAVGMLLGTIGSIISVRKYLKV